jgi:hypothetical protein
MRMGDCVSAHDVFGYAMLSGMFCFFFGIAIGYMNGRLHEIDREDAQEPDKVESE